MNVAKEKSCSSWQRMASNTLVFREKEAHGIKDSKIRVGKIHKIVRVKESWILMIGSHSTPIHTSGVKLETKIRS